MPTETMKFHKGVFAIETANDPVPVFSHNNVIITEIIIIGWVTDVLLWMHDPRSIYEIILPAVGEDKKRAAYGVWAKNRSA